MRLSAFVFAAAVGLGLVGCPSPQGDPDGDGFGDSLDCGPDDPQVHPGADERCNGVDDDCDGEIDEDAVDGTSYWFDVDGDGFGDPAQELTACSPPGGVATSSGDCDDGDAEIHPGAAELCDGVDNDCDGVVDPANSVDATAWYPDGDGDGFGDEQGEQFACSAPSGHEERAGDCDDDDPEVHPDAEERCNGTDDDCDGAIDPDTSVDAGTWYADGDGDGWGDEASTALACEAPTGFVEHPGDCDDANDAVHPGELERCDGAVDEDCDGLVDDEDVDVLDTTIWYQDSDGDGYGDPSTVTNACEAPTGWVADGGDCDDTDAALNPAAQEVCDDADVDEDCDGAADDADPSVDASAGTPWYPDLDGDGYGDGTTGGVLRCDAPASSAWVLDASDCDDVDAGVNPSADEVCDAADLDEDCDGLADDGDGSTLPASMTRWYPDEDADGFGDDAHAGVLHCDDPSDSASRWSSAAGDCDDADASISPAAVESCTGLDDDCDGLVDEDDPSVVGLSTFYADLDGDSYGDAGNAVDACSAPDGMVTDASDCDDALAAVHPSASEICDGLDNDCDGSVDPSTAADAATWYADADGDGYGDVGSTQLACTQPSGFVSDDEDCDDAQAAISPAALELCNGVDDDCDGSVDPSTSVDARTWAPDIDGDGYGDAGGAVSACSAPSGSVADASDCDDDNAGIHPGATETCDGVDEDCDGLVDDSPPTAPTWYLDADGDGYGDPTTTGQACTEGSGFVSDDSDCDDGDAEVHPGEEEICWEAADEDCDGLTSDDDDCAPTDAAHTSTGWIMGSSSETLGSDLAFLDDFDADGGDELALSSTSAASGAGMVWVFDAFHEPEDPRYYTWDAALELTGTSAGDAFGVALDGLEDFDGDGFPDLAVGAYGEDTTAADAGAVYLYSLDAGMRGALGASAATEVFYGSSEDEALGGVVASAGDVDGDGLTDLLMAAEDHDLGGQDAGVIWLVLGGDSGHTLDTASDVLFVGELQGDELGVATGAGDVDGDGYDDVLLGADRNDEAGSSAGKVYLWRGPFSLDRYEAGAAQLRILGSDSGDYTGSDLVGVGDLDADGHADIAVAARGRDRGSASSAGAVGVFQGPLPSGTMEFEDADTIIQGDASSDGSYGVSLGGGGDVDGDGYDDLLLGVKGSDLGGSGSGGAFLFYGPLSSGTARYSDADAVFIGGSSWYYGDEVDLGGDLDGDGYADLGFTNDYAPYYGQVLTYTGGPRLEDAAAEPVDSASDDDGDGYSEDDGDCDDRKASRAPNLTEVCGSGSDEDCDGWADVCFPDAYLVDADIPTWVSSDYVPTSSYSSGRLGYNLRIVGDLSGDGVRDLVVADPSRSSSAGRVAVYFGPVAAQAQTSENADAYLSGSSSRQVAGATLHPAGDLDADGYDDLSVGASGGGLVSMEDGLVVVFRGGPTMTGSQTTAEATWRFGTGDPYDHAYWGAGVGDVDGDGYDDFAVGAYDDDDGDLIETGSVGLFYGPLAAGDYDVDADADVLFVGEGPEQHLGSYVQPAGDLNGDGYDDLVLYASDWVHDLAGTDYYQGQLYVFYGPIEQSGRVELRHADAFIPIPPSYHSWVWTSGDLTGDGYPDLVVSAGYTEWAVLSMVGKAGVIEPDDEAEALLQDDAFWVYEDADLAVGDMNGDGYGDLVVGATDFSPYPEGGAWVLLGPLEGELELDDADLFVEDSYNHGTGYTVDLGDLDGDGFDDLAIGIPEEDSGSLGEGVFVVLPGGWDGGSVHGLSLAPEPGEDGDGDGYTAADGDCDDTRSDVSPVAGESCGDTVDEDCDGHALICAPTGTVTIEAPVDHIQIHVSSMAAGDWLPMGDVDGDGGEDVAVSNTVRSEVYVLLSPFPTGTSNPYYVSDAIFDGASTGEEPSGPMALLDDADGDGAAELAISAVDDSAVFVMGSADLWEDRSLDTAAWRFDGASPGSFFGEIIVGAGDLDGDGIEEFVVSERGSDGAGTDSGAVHTFSMGLPGASYGLAATSLSVLGDATDRQLGLGLCTLGDLDGDGLGDLGFTEARLTHSDAELSYVWLGDASTGILSSSDAPIILEREADASEGALPRSAGDLDGDGQGDLVLASPDWTDRSAGLGGRVYLWSGLPSTELAGDADWIISGAVLTDELGTTVSSEVDLDGDGHLDLLIGAPGGGATVGNGAVHVWYGPLSISGSSLSSGSDATIQNEPTMTGLGDRILPSGDLDGDDYGDLLLNTNEGCLVFRGGPQP